MKISRAYGVLIEDEGIALRGMFLIDPKGILRSVVNSCSIGCLLIFLFFFPHCEFCGLFKRAGVRMYSQITINDLPVGRSIDEALRLVKAFQFTVRLLFLHLIT
jgi:alkyl hydroperoxide reductase subunit AhpC